MKTPISSLVAGTIMAFTLAACSSTPMNSDTAMGSSGSSASGTSASSGVGTTSGVATGAQGMNSSRSSTPINCTNNTTASGTDVATTPGMNCPNESH